MSMKGEEGKTGIYTNSNSGSSLHCPLISKALSPLPRAVLPPLAGWSCCSPGAVTRNWFSESEEDLAGCLWDLSGYSQSGGLGAGQSLEH